MMKYSEFRTLVGDRRLHIVTVSGAQYITDSYWCVPVLKLPAKVLSGLPFPLPDGSYQYHRGKLTPDHGAKLDPTAVEKVMAPHAQRAELDPVTVDSYGLDLQAFAQVQDTIVRLYRVGKVPVAVRADLYAFIRECVGYGTTAEGSRVKPATSRVLFCEGERVVAALMPYKLS